MFKQYVPGLRDELARTIATTPGMVEFFGRHGALDALELLEEAPFPSPTSISALLSFDELYAVSEIDYTFEAKFTLILAWYDSQIFRSCGVHPWDEPLQCAEVWRPKVSLVNAKAVEGAALEPVKGSEVFVALEPGWEKQMSEPSCSSYGFNMLLLPC